jgi:hypothetical protein
MISIESLWVMGATIIGYTGVAWTFSKIVIKEMDDEEQSLSQIGADNCGPKHYFASSRTCKPDGVVISESTRKLVEGFFDLQKLGPKQLKGVPYRLET